MRRHILDEVSMDIPPNTTREHLRLGVTTFVALFGLLFAALITGLIIQALQLTAEEKSAHTLVTCLNLAKQYRHQAANVVKFAIKSWYIKRHAKFSGIRFFYNQQKLFYWIKAFQILRRKERLLDEVKDESSGENTTSLKNEPTTSEILKIQSEMHEMKLQFNRLNDNLESFQNTLNVLLNKRR